jgi:hypothetical protein
MVAAADDDDEYSAVFEVEQRLQTPEERKRESCFRGAAKTGANCADCGRVLEPSEPVWRIRRKFDGGKIEVSYSSGLPAIYETEEVVAPICQRCWGDGHTRVTLTQSCGGCGRPVYVTPKALKSWLRHGQQAYCCEACTHRPPIQSDASITRACAVCGRSFALKRLDAIYCGATCRQKANRARKKVGPTA